MAVFHYYLQSRFLYIKDRNRFLIRSLIPKSHGLTA